MSRDPAAQTWPVFRKIANAAVCAATARSGASAKTMFGPLPPHSVQTGFMFDSAEYFMNSLPTSVEPVKPTTSMSG